MEAPGLKLKEEAFGFNPPLVAAGDGCCEGSNSSLSSQLIVSSSTQSLVRMVLPLCHNAKPSRRYYLALQYHNTLAAQPSLKHGQRLLSLPKLATRPMQAKARRLCAAPAHKFIRSFACRSLLVSAEYHRLNSLEHRRGASDQARSPAFAVSDPGGVAAQSSKIPSISSANSFAILCGVIDENLESWPRLQGAQSQ